MKEFQLTNKNVCIWTWIKIKLMYDSVFEEVQHTLPCLSGFSDSYCFNIIRKKSPFKCSACWWCLLTLHPLINSFPQACLGFYWFLPARWYCEWKKRRFVCGVQVLASSWNARATYYVWIKSDNLLIQLEWTSIDLKSFIVKWMVFSKGNKKWYDWGIKLMATIR